MMEAAKFHQPQEPEKQIVLLSLSPKVSKPLKLLMQCSVLRQSQLENPEIHGHKTQSSKTRKTIVLC